MMTSVTRSCFTKQHQTCKTKTKQGQIQEFENGGTTFPSPPFSPSLLFSPLPLEVGPLNAGRGPGEHCKLPQQGSGQSPGRQCNFGIFGAQERQVARI